MELVNLIENLSKQAWINVYRRNFLQDARTKTGIHFKFVENDTPLSSVFAYAGQFVRIEVDGAKKSVKSVEVVEYTPCTTMMWVEANEKRHWSTIPQMYRCKETGGIFRLECVSICKETGRELVTYSRPDVPSLVPQTVTHEEFFGGGQCEGRFELIRELMTL
ncbi:MAG: hypothetical protein ACRCZZ_05425 [Phocaeicola sp.]